MPLFGMVSPTVLFPFFTTSLKVRSTMLKVDANDDNGDDDGDDDKEGDNGSQPQSLAKMKNTQTSS